MTRLANNVELDSIIDNILKQYSLNDSSDIFEIIHEELGDNYSLDDVVDYINDKECIKKKFAIIFMKQRYDRVPGGHSYRLDDVKDLF